MNSTNTSNFDMLKFMLCSEDWGVSLEANNESKIEQLIISRKRFNFQCIELKKEKVQRKKRHT